MKNTSGQSLFEVVVALAITTLIVIALVSLASSSIRNSVFSRNKTLSSRYTQEAIEWLRGERDADWRAFSTRATTSSTWCLPSLSWASAKIGTCLASDVISGTDFKREITFNIIDPTNIQTTLKVYWSDAQGLHEVTSITNFTDWRAR